jgi:hypothetical protein
LYVGVHVAANDRGRDHGDGGLARRGRVSGLHKRLQDGHLSSARATQRSIHDDGIAAVPLEHRGDGTLAPAHWQHTHRSRELRPDAPVRIIQPLQHRGLERVLGLRQPPFGDAYRRGPHVA